MFSKDDDHSDEGVQNANKDVQRRQVCKPITPSEAIQRYIECRRDEVTRKTLEEYENDLSTFAGYCADEELRNLNNLSGKFLDGYRAWLRTESTDEVEVLSKKRMRDHMYLLGSFVEYVESIEGVPPGMAEKVRVPEIDTNDGVRDVRLESELVEQVLRYLERFEYATFGHVVWVLLAGTGRRLGGIRSLDIGDLHLQRDDPYIEYRHRPPETRLKNAERGEAYVNISQETASILADFVDHNRVSVTTDAGREPLLSTQYGRAGKSTIRRYVYKWSQPCRVGLDCPHDREPEDCVATDNKDEYSKCPTAEGPHAIRHTYLTERRRDSVPVEVLEDRCDVSAEVLKKHYDERTPEEKRKQRRQALDDTSSDDGEVSY